MYTGYFVLYIYCTSMTTGIFPKMWSNGTVILPPKSGDLSDPGNWRPITQTSVFAKLFEKNIHNRLYSHFELNNIFSKFQYGFLPNKSTQLASFDLVKHIYSSGFKPLRLGEVLPSGVYIQKVGSF